SREPSQAALREPKSQSNRLEINCCSRHKTTVSCGLTTVNMGDLCSATQLLARFCCALYPPADLEMVEQLRIERQHQIFWDFWIVRLPREHNPYLVDEVLLFQAAPLCVRELVR